MSIESATAAMPGFGVSASARAEPRVEICDLMAVPQSAWADLADRAAEPNAFFLPAWARAVDAHARGRRGARALLAWDGQSRSRLIGFLPVVSAWRAYKLPLPVFVAWEAYARVSVPLLDRERAVEAASGILAAASHAGANALLLPFLACDGPAAQAFLQAAQKEGPQPRFSRAHRRARLDATLDADAMLREMLGAKKLKELRRQRNRLADDGDVTFSVAREPGDIARALDQFLRLENSGWKGERGTSLAGDAGDRVFVREAMTALASQGWAEIATLSRGGVAVASGLVLRHARRAYFFKIGHDAKLAKMSPGVQLTLDLTKHLCTDPGIDDVDSTADADHPMIDHVWSGRSDISDLLLPTRTSAFVFDCLATAIAGRHAARDAACKAINLVRSR